MFATCLCARFQADPREYHLIAIKRIFRCLKGTPNLGIWYPRESRFDLERHMLQPIYKYQGLNST